jgi:hypothetical protein
MLDIYQIYAFWTCRQKVGTNGFEWIYKLSVKIHLNLIDICGVFCSQKVGTYGYMDFKVFIYIY